MPICPISSLNYAPFALTSINLLDFKTQEQTTKSHIKLIQGPLEKTYES